MFTMLFVISMSLGCSDKKIEPPVTKPSELVRLPITLEYLGPTSVRSGDTVKLELAVDAPDGIPTKAQWLQTEGPSVTLSSVTSERPTFVAPEINSGSASLVFEVTVQSFDSVGSPTTKSVRIDLLPVAISLSAGDDVVTYAESEVTLHGVSNLSVDHPQDIQWTQTHGQQVTLINADTYSPSFTAPRVNSVEELIFTLKVVTAGAEVDDEISVSISPVPSEIVYAMPNPDVMQFAVPEPIELSVPVPTSKVFKAEAGSNVALAPTASIPQGFSTQWRQISGPPVSIISPEAQTTSFTAPHGESNIPIIIRLTITNTDNGELTATDQEIHVVATRMANKIDVLPGSEVSVHSVVPLSPGESVSHSWTQISGPPITLTGQTTSNVTFTAPITPSEIKIENTATPSSTGVAKVTVHSINVVPVDKISHESQTAYTDSRVTLHAIGTASTSYTWSQLSGPTVSLSTTSQSSTQFTSPNSTVDGASIEIQSTAVTPAENGQPAITETKIYTIKLLAAKPQLSAIVKPANIATVAGEVGRFNATVSGGTAPYSYDWTYLSGPVLTLDESEPSSPSFIAPSVLTQSASVYSITIEDSEGKKLILTTSIQLKPAPPFRVEISSPPFSVSGTQVGLYASALGDVASYAWSQTRGPSVVLSQDNSYAPFFTAPAVTVSTLFSFEVTVTDALSNIHTKEVTIQVIPTPLPNIDILKVQTPPKISLLEGETTTLAVGVSGGVAPYAYDWQLASSNLIGSLDNRNSSTPQYTIPATLDQDIDLPLSVTVTDNNGESITSPVMVRGLNRTLIVDAGNDIDTKPDSQLNLHAQIVNPTGALPYTYLWTQVGASNISITNSNSNNPLIVLPTGSGVYEFSLNVTDSAGRVATDSVKISATENLVANAGKNQSVVEEALVTLHGLDVGALGSTSVEWTQIEGPSVSIDDADTLNPSFMAPSTATPIKLSFLLTAIDSKMRQATDSISITVQPNPPIVQIIGSVKVVENNQATYSAHASGGVPPYTYQWQSLSGDIALTFNSPVDEKQVTVSTPSFTKQDDLGHINVEVTDVRGRKVNDTITLSLGQAPSAPVLNVTANLASNLPSGGSSPIVSSVSNGTAPYQFDWSDQNDGGSFGPDNSVQNPLYTAPQVSSNKVITVSVDVEDANNEQAYTNETILVKATPIKFKINSNVQVQRGQIVSLHAAFSGATLPVTATWKNISHAANTMINENKSVSVNTDSYSYDTSELTPGDYLITFTVKEAGGRERSALFNLTVVTPNRTFIAPNNTTVAIEEHFTGKASITPTFSGEEFTFTVSKSPATAPDLTISPMKGKEVTLSAQHLSAGVDAHYTVIATNGNEQYQKEFNLKTKKAIKPVSAIVCSGDTCGLIPGLDPSEQCSAATPFAVTTFKNSDDGSQVFTKSCGSQNFCERDWWQGTSDRTECIQFDTDQTYYRNFECSYCCTSDNCNQNAFPPKNTLYKGKS